MGGRAADLSFCLTIAATPTFLKPSFVLHFPSSALWTLLNFPLVKNLPLQYTFIKLRH